MWLRALDTSKSFTVKDVVDIPIEFIERPDDVPETSAGDLWAYNGALYKRPGFFEEADKNFPGWNKSPNGTVFDFWKLVTHLEARDSYKVLDDANFSFYLGFKV